MNGLHFSHNHKHSALVAKAALMCLALVATSAFAQGGAGSKGYMSSYQDDAGGPSLKGAMSPYQDEKDGVTAGGKWMEFQSEDKMTGAKKVRFELLADNYLKEDQDFKPRVELFCSNGKMTLADFNPGARLAPPNRPGFWGQPQMEVMVRIDDTHSYHGWNWIRGHFLSMDKGTTRGMIGAQVFKVEVGTRGGREIAEFSPGGLNLDQVKQACDLTPKKPSKD